MRPALPFRVPVPALAGVTSLFVACLWATPAAAQEGAGASASALGAATPTDTAPAPPALDVDGWAEGQRLLEAGDWVGALARWEEAWENLSGDGMHDPRLGISFVETATEWEAEDRYDTASRIYLWSLGTPSLPEGAEALDQELERLRLLWSDEEAARFDSLAAAGSDGVRLALKRYWIERDPTPSSPENERLIEHWSRIRNARDRYTYNRSSPIDTDDRGIVYLKYGDAARIVRGSLGASEFELRIRIPDDHEARARLRQYDTNPQYEIWKYEGLNSDGASFFLFGNVDGTGPFELVETVTDLIPPQAMSRNSTRFTPGGIPAGFYLELFYYRDLSVMGWHYGDRFRELSARWDQATYRRQSTGSAAPRAPSESSLEGLRFRFEQEDRYDPPTPPEIPLVSEFEGSARDEIVAQMIRTLSDDGVPLLVLVGTSAPRYIAEIHEDDDAELAFDFPEWVMRHTLIVRDREMDEVGRLVQPISAERADVSSFVLRHVTEPLHLTMTARTLRVSQNGLDTLVVGSRLPGQETFVPGEPLQNDTSRLILSDVMTGTPIPQGIRPDVLPYPILPTTTIWRGDLLRVYVEMFNAGDFDAGRASLDARFVVVPLNDDRTPDFDRQPVTLSVNLAPEAGTPYREAFDMQLRDQELGFYEVVIEITDRARGQTMRRSRVIELVE